jgi:sialate O-acetylesterase
MKRITILLLLVFSITNIYAEIKLPVIISDGMVFQRDTKFSVYGWASPDERVSLQFKGKRYNTRADKSGSWSFELPPQKAGGPFDMVFKGENEITVNDILFGDVWLFSGQSNMTVMMERVKEKYPEEIMNANFPDIRYFFVPTKSELNGPEKDLPPGTWKQVTQENILDIGAISYFFAKIIYAEYKIPIGLINSSVGGTPIEAWISEEGFKDYPEIVKRIEQNKDTSYLASLRKPAVNIQPRQPNDKGMLENPKWYEISYIPKGWYNINIPGYWEDQGVKNLNGVVWYRKEIDIPASMTGMPAKLFMGRIVDADVMYVNGEKIGNITYQYPPRRYEIPAGLLKPGKNLLVIQVTNTSGKGGFVPDKPYYLTANNQEIDLKGTWLYKVGEVYEPVRFGGGSSFSAQNQPAALYNAMIAPLVNQKVKGFLWYQGESNAGSPKPYYGYLTSLINDWRDKWQDGNLPFLYVQLANYMDVDYLPTESSWAELRFAQFKALSLPNTAMAVAIDLGEWNDIHPLNKKDVGERLAYGALKYGYNQDIVYSGPIYESSKKEGNKIIVSFKVTGSGLTTNDGEELRRFEIAGSDGKFVWAEAKIIGNTVEVWNNNIESPVKVRYAWSDNPRDANLYNREGLPASPFETAE